MHLASPLRRGLLAPLALAILAFAPAAADAAITSTKITTPSDPTYRTIDLGQDDLSTQTFDIAGTTDSTDAANDAVNIRCYFTRNGERDDFPVTSEPVPVNEDGTFTLTAELQTLMHPNGWWWDYVLPHSCVLRAVPVADDSDPAFLGAFQGPSLHVGELYGEDKDSETGNVYDWGTANPQPKGFWSYRDFGSSESSCGGLTGQPYAAGTAYASYDFLSPWHCAGALNASDRIDTASIVIDGQEAFDPRAQWDRADTAPGSGFTWKSVVDPLNGNVTITETSAIQRCADDVCSEWTSAGVTLERTIVQDHEGRMATVTDGWTSTDGKDHKIQLGYVNPSAASSGNVCKQANASITGCGGGGSITYELPGETEYTAPPQEYSAVEGLATAPATIRVRVSAGGNGDCCAELRAAAATAAEDSPASYGALTYTTAPDGIVWTGGYYGGGPYGDGEAFTLRYTRSIPAGGTFSLTQIYGVADTEAQIGLLGVAAEDKVSGPSVTITTPASGSTVNAADQTVTGTATDNVGVKSLTINGKTVAVGANGAYSTPITLAPGQNTITAVATDAEGNSAQAQSVVTYVPPKVKPTRKCKVPKVTKKTLTAARKAIKKAGCVVGKVKAKATRSAKPGRVIAQSRKAGARVAIGTKVKLTVAKPKPRRVTRPTFTG